jgi:predicted Fe-S protein YdhL (DUF1289 family)
VEKTLEEVAIFSIMDDDELQEVLTKINKRESFKSMEILDLLRQILHWRSMFESEKKNVQFLIKMRDKYKNEVEKMKKA